MGLGHQHHWVKAKSGDLKNLMHTVAGSKAAGPNPRSPTPKPDDLARAMRIELKDGAELPSPIDRNGSDSDDSDNELDSPRPVVVTVLPMIHGLEANGRARAHAVLYGKGSLSSDKSSLKFKGIISDYPWPNILELVTFTGQPARKDSQYNSMCWNALSTQ